VIDLQLGILELFSEAQQRSSYFCAYNEREAFTVRRGNGGSVYRCELCGSLASEHRCPFSDQAPPEGFTCLAHRPYRALTVNELERQRTANRERYRRQPRLTPLPKELRRVQCRACGARAPQHRCIEKRDGQ
jgi:hypothetical protein